MDETNLWKSYRSFMRLKCISSPQWDKPPKGITPNKIYQVVDKDTIGYKIIDVLDRKVGYSTFYFEPLEETRDKLLDELLDGIF